MRYCPVTTLLKVSSRKELRSASDGVAGAMSSICRQARNLGLPARRANRMPLSRSFDREGDAQPTEQVRRQVSGTHANQDGGDQHRYRCRKVNRMTWEESRLDLDSVHRGAPLSA
jgi:hypothetical protein